MSESKQDNRPPLPPGGFWDEIGDEEWSDEDLAKLTRYHWPDKERSQDKTSDKPKDGEK
jgi:hypothetical protein